MVTRVCWGVSHNMHPAHSSPPANHRPTTQQAYNTTTMPPHTSTHRLHHLQACNPTNQHTSQPTIPGTAPRVGGPTHWRRRRPPGRHQ
jgi:hypothetical protein